MRVYPNISLLPGSRSTFSEVDPDPAKWYGSNWIRNTAWTNCNFMFSSIIRRLLSLLSVAAKIPVLPVLD